MVDAHLNYRSGHAQNQSFDTRSYLLLSRHHSLLDVTMYYTVVEFHSDRKVYTYVINLRYRTSFIVKSIENVEYQNIEFQTDKISEMLCSHFIM